MRALQKLILPAMMAACGGLAACSTTSVKSTQSLAPAAVPNVAKQASDDPSGNAEDGARSLAYEVESGAAPKESRLRKKLEKQARLQPEVASGAAQETAALAEPEGSTADAEAPDGDGLELPTMTAMLPEPRPDGAPLASVAASARPANVQVASLDPSIGVSQERFGAADPQVPLAGAAGARLASLGGQGDDNAPPAPPQHRVGPSSVAARSLELDQLIAHYASYYGVPEKLVRRVAKRESTFNPRATNGPYLGLMQISLPTARGMGYRGDRGGLLDAETNLKYAVRYLRGAYLVARGDHDKADRLYQTGYYYHAKRAGLLDETGVGRDRKRLRPL